MIVVRPLLGFHASLGRGNPCTLELRKMRDFVPVRSGRGTLPAAGDLVASRLLREVTKEPGFFAALKNDTKKF